MLHGNPTWSFLWRKVIARVAPNGVRVIAPDLLGLGLSDKPRDFAAHTLDNHVSTMLRLVEALDLDDITIAGQDWGGPIAAGVAARAPHRVRGAVFGNTAVLRPKSPIRTTWFHRLSHVPVVSNVVFRGFNFPIPILPRVQGDPKSIGRFERRAYGYPLRRFRDRIAPLALARMVPNLPDHPSLRVLDETEGWARAFRGPVALVWGLRDPILGRALHRMRQTFPHARVTETQAGHFLQEEVPDELAAAILDVTKA
jgi:haloalkane dehalogenase